MYRTKRGTFHGMTSLVIKQLKTEQLVNLYKFLII